MEQNKYQHSDKLPLSLVVEELEKDAEFTDKALQILSVEDRGSTHTRWTAVSALISHWLVNRDLNCYINGKLVDDVTALPVLPVGGDYGAGIKALENWMTISMDELAELLEHRNLAVPAFLRPSDAPAAKVEAVRGIGKRKVMVAFQDIKWDYDKWGKNLASPSDKLAACRIAKGNKKESALWNPADIGLYLLDEGVKINILNAVFVGLKDWADEWREKTALERD